MHQQLARMFLSREYSGEEVLGDFIHDKEFMLEFLEQLKQVTKKLAAGKAVIDLHLAE